MTYLSDIDKADRVQEAVDFPKVILIDNCSACNLRCSICDHKHIKKYRRIQKMPWELYTRIIDEIALENPGARVWEIFFGEPCLLKDMPARIAYAKACGLKDVVLNSNGVLLTPEKSKAFIQAGLDALYVGIDAATENTYDTIRIGGDFNKVIRNVLTYRDLLEVYGTRYQKLFVQFVVSDVNEKEVDLFKAFWNQEGVNIKIRPKVSWAGLVRANNLRRDEKIERKPCYWLMHTMNICADGRIAFCSVDVHCRVSCGNATEKPLRDLWHGALKNFRSMHIHGDYQNLPELCRSCFDWQSAYAEFYLKDTPPNDADR